MVRGGQTQRESPSDEDPGERQLPNRLPQGGPKPEPPGISLEEGRICKGESLGKIETKNCFDGGKAGLCVKESSAGQG